MGGDILVDSVVGEGSRFCVRLPLRPADDAEAQAERPVSALLVLDRSPITRSMWRTLLERRAGRLVFAANVGEALDLIAADRTDRILIDDTTLCADPDPAAALRRLGDAARRQGAETTLLWGADRDGRDAMAACVTRIAMKPIGGQSLVAVLFGQDCDGARSSPLVSQAA
jgi:CheY-like chemotaxis protein